MGLTDRKEAIERIKKALRVTTKKSWSVRGGVGTSYGFIFVLPLPKDQPTEGTMTPRQAVELARAFGLHEPVHYQGLGISSDRREEYLRRIEGGLDRVTEKTSGDTSADTLVKYEGQMGHVDFDDMFRDVNRFALEEFIAKYGERNAFAAERYWKLVRKGGLDTDFFVQFLQPARDKARGRLTSTMDRFCSDCVVERADVSGHCKEHGMRVRGCWRNGRLLPPPWPSKEAYPYAVRRW